MIGTTDVKDVASTNPIPTDEEIEFLKKEGKKVFGNDFDYEGKIKAVWAGQRPLVFKGEAKDEKPHKGFAKVLSYFNKVSKEVSTK